MAPGHRMTLPGPMSRMLSEENLMVKLFMMEDSGLVSRYEIFILHDLCKIVLFYRIS